MERMVSKASTAKKNFYLKATKVKYTYFILRKIKTINTITGIVETYAFNDRRRRRLHRRAKKEKKNRHRYQFFSF